MTLNAKSIERLTGVHPHLVAIVQRTAAASAIPFQVSEGLRTPERQRELVAKGASQTQNSRHLTGHAVDVVLLNPDGSANWDFAKYREFSKDFLAAAAALSHPVIWGGAWTTLRDGPHFELDRKVYP
ncbi:M15 family metallopeptidase [Xylophilus sp.]|uniref:M15 family metallopeptidase n=1 Tax=Xylophilus sp. TaxID=2653893 RepID=UPI0013BAAEA0|nr:M15 family metallopeptidase [Xylophilus sp.]KAF1049325.1 MAG: Peptidoglycan L-alanyl-D-glutamate endopeptidase CwlK [Xylophilus sp.]